MRRCFIRRIEEWNTRLLVWIELPKQLLIPVAIVRGQSMDLLADLVKPIKGLVLEITDLGDTVLYKISIPRSSEIPDGVRLNEVLSAMSEVLDECLEDIPGKVDPKSSALFAVDTARPNVLSKVIGYCLRNPNAFTLRLMDAIKVWFLDDLKVKAAVLRECLDENILVGTRLNKKERRELEDAIITRHRFLEVIHWSEKCEYKHALELAAGYEFI